MISFIKIKQQAVSLLVIFLIAQLHAASSLENTTGQEIVAKHSITLTSPTGKPTQLMARGPLLATGDVGVMQSGPAEELTTYICKNKREFYLSSLL